MGDLVRLDFRELVFGKVLGQGHIDEIGQKLSSYIQGQEKERTRRLDIASWVRGLCGELETKRAYLLCERFGLHDCCPVSIGELGEIKRASSEIRLRWTEEALRQLRHTPRLSKWAEIVSAFLVPWMRQRQGIASLAQLTERLQQVSIQKELVSPFLKLLRELLQCSCPFAIVLPIAEGELFCEGEEPLRLYREVLDLCRSYFRPACSQYSLRHILQLITQEMTKRWETIDAPFVERCLRLSSNIVIRKIPKVGLVVRIAL